MTDPRIDLVLERLDRLTRMVEQLVLALAEDVEAEPLLDLEGQSWGSERNTLDVL